MKTRDKSDIKKQMVLICTKNETTTLTDFCRDLGVTRKERTEIRDLADELCDEKVLLRVGGSRFQLFRESETRKNFGEVEGEIRITAGGSGFVKAGENMEDVYVTPENIGGALDGDIVRISKWPGYRGAEGRVEEVTERRRQKIAGILRKSNKSWFIEPDDPRLNRKVMCQGKPSKGTEGKVVLATIAVFPENRTDPLWVEVEKNIGEPGLLTTEVEKTIILSGIVDKWNLDVEDYVKCVPVEVYETDHQGRTDLREIPLMTIDPKDARDFDDAIHVERDGDDYILYVAIADVSHYVVAGTPVDAEARRRALSIYLPDRAIPMLHSKLSSEICSLKPHVDRLCMATKIRFSKTGERLDYTVFPAVMNSKARLCYEDVALVIKTPRDEWNTGEIIPSIPAKERIMLAYELAQVLHKMRMKRGSLELDIPEAKVLLDEDDPLRVRDVVNLRPDPHLKAAYNLVEEAMLAANEAVGHYVTEHKLNVPWRIHDVPDEEKIQHFKVFAMLMGLKPADVDAKDMCTLIEKISEHPASRPLFYSLLRSMKQASYNEKNVGHFALAAPTYLHFTSPIRRYPDLCVHRALKSFWFGKGMDIGNEKRTSLVSTDEAAKVSFFTSTNERKAVELERKVTDIYRAWFMRPLIGTTFDAKISGITTFGLFSMIEHPFIEGMTRFDWIEDDIMEFIPELGVCHGMKTGMVVVPGDSVKILVARCDVAQGQISFELSGGLFDQIEKREFNLEGLLKEIRRRTENLPKPSRRQRPGMGDEKSSGGGSSRRSAGGGSRGGAGSRSGSSQGSGKTGGRGGRAPQGTGSSSSSSGEAKKNNYRNDGGKTPRGSRGGRGR
ncbi:VacB/RNase II family 3'-5' exoribonuclease [Myxococcota bacterium]|nr:VacB/RNase II family 3'-5' exoribonuclease [Myxococcota bacterium]MBU1380425.1 VacB/RNase II family 3'-5' exoribonuclease [Myxococcota bacterium]MBU1498357.1 VacB/RNase II family 3'-5' exoribonuclease [Myxococcota bacterium]